MPLKKLLRIQSAPARDDNTLPAFEPPVERTESAPAGAMDVEGGAEGDAEDDGPVRYHSMSDNERASFHRLKVGRLAWRWRRAASGARCRCCGAATAHATRTPVG